MANPGRGLTEPGGEAAAPVTGWRAGEPAGVSLDRVGAAPAAGNALRIRGIGKPGRSRTHSPWREDRRAVRRLLTQLLWFTGIGAGSTVGYGMTYLLLRHLLNAEAANAIARFLIAVANTAANRRFTFCVRGRARAGRHQLQGLFVFCIGLAVTTAALAGLHAVMSRPAHSTEVIVLLAASGVATALKFTLFRVWIFGAVRRTKINHSGLRGFRVLAARGDRPERGRKYGKVSHS